MGRSILGLNLYGALIYFLRSSLTCKKHFSDVLIDQVSTLPSVHHDEFQIGYSNNEIVLKVKHQTIERWWSAFRVHDECLVKTPIQLVVPTSLQSPLIQLAQFGHPGIVRTKRRFREIYWWPVLDADVDTFICGCEGCQPSVESINRWFRLPTNHGLKLQFTYQVLFTMHLRATVLDCSYGSILTMVWNNATKDITTTVIIKQIFFSIWFTRLNHLWKKTTV